MNKEGRELINKWKGTVEELQTGLQDLHSDVEELAEGERGKYDNMPESLQSSDRGEAMNAAAEALEAAVSEIQTAIDSLDSVLGQLGEAEGE